MHFYELQELFSVIIDRKKYKEKSDRLIRYLIQSKNTDRVIMECLFDSITKLCKEDRIEYLLLFINENPSIDDFRTVPLTSLSDSWSGSQIPLIEKNFFCTNIQSFYRSEELRNFLNNNTSAPFLFIKERGALI